MFVKTKFSIKDLENLTGIKAHTIRIWEKRYNLLSPTRTETNIRCYSLEDLKKLLNITFLQEHGHKISKIAARNKEQMTDAIAELAISNKEAHAINAFKAAMFQFDQQLFSNTFQELLEECNFQEIFKTVFIPLLTELGILWQIGTIDPCHERFVSEMIKQKIILNIEKQYENNVLTLPPTFALFLPPNEIHDIGLIYSNYLCISHDINTIYLGNNISMESLKEILKHHENIHFLTYLTVEPAKPGISDFCKAFNDSISNSGKNQLWLLGSKIQNCEKSQLPENVVLSKNISDFTGLLKNLKKR